MQHKQVGGNRQTLPTHWTFADGTPTGNFHQMASSVHEAEGWFVVGTDPVPNPETEKLGADTMTGGVWAYVLVDQTEQEQADTLQAYKDSIVDSNRRDCSNLILEAYPELYQRNVSLGVYVDTNMVTNISALIEEENRVADLIDAATDFATVDAAQALLAWPNLIGGA